MPNVSGFITNREVKEIRSLAMKGLTNDQISSLVGRGRSQVSRYSGNMTSLRDRAQRYDRLVRLASAFVPTFGGGR